MTGLRSQRSMKRGSTPTPVCSELRLFSREAIALKSPVAGSVSEIEIYRHPSLGSQIPQPEEKKVCTAACQFFAYC
jgi:hypothetical protein